MGFIIWINSFTQTVITFEKRSLTLMQAKLMMENNRQAPKKVQHKLPTIMQLVKKPCFYQRQEQLKCFGRDYTQNPMVHSKHIHLSNEQHPELIFEHVGPYLRLTKCFCQPFSQVLFEWNQAVLLPLSQEFKVTGFPGQRCTTSLPWRWDQLVVIIICSWRELH